jgi:hypothetical protein
MIVNYDHHLFIVQATDRGGSATIRALEDSVVDCLSLLYRFDAVAVGQMSIFRKPKSQMASGNFFLFKQVLD